MILDDVDDGLLTTVQDAGRPAWTHLGVPVSGPADPWSHAIANLLAGNAPDAAGLEMTVVGPTMTARDDGLIGLAGADLGARVRGGRRLEIGRSHRIHSGETIEVPGHNGGSAGAGARCYLAVAAGIDVPLVLGSRSTCLAGGFGGLEGRALRVGDVVRSRRAGGPGRDAQLAWPDDEPDALDARTGPAASKRRRLRVLAGPATGLQALVGEPWRVSPAADRVGVRLEGRSLPDGIGGETLTHGVQGGAVQVPSDGRPILLSADHQTTGGYRVPAVVISADLPILGQLLPGDEVVLEATDLPAAITALRDRRARLARGAELLREAAGWDDLAGSAGG
jgi:antagonist of KipI